MIFLKSITVKNFGGVCDGKYEFEERISTIKGASGSGKSTAYFAYLWALGFNVSSWEPKISGCRIHKLKTEVHLELEIDGQIHILSKVNTPDYKVNKFTGNEEYYGATVECSIDGVKMAFSAYRDKIVEYFGVDYFDLELLSNLSMFNNEDSKRWNKNERRKYLFKLFDIDNQILSLKDNPEFESIKEFLEQGKDELEIGQIITASKSAIDKELKANQILREEKQRELVELSKINFDDLAKKKDAIESQITDLQTQSNNSATQTLWRAKMDEYNETRNELADLHTSHSAEKRNFTERIDEILNDINFLKERKLRFEKDLEDFEIDKKDIEESKFDDANTICPMCKQQLPSEKIQELKESFRERNTQMLNDVNKKINDIKINLQATESKLCNLEKELSNLKNGVIELDKKYDAEDRELRKKMDTMQKEADNILNAQDANVITSKLNELKTEFGATIAELSKQDQVIKIQNRINELNMRDRELAVQDAERLQRKEALQKYTETKIGLVNSEVNKHFNGVSFNFYKYLSASASKEYEPICNATLNHVEYDALSSGQKIKADYIINSALREIFKVNIPQFVDDVVLSDFSNIKDRDWQQVFLYTTDESNINLTLIQDVFSINDCDIKK